MPSAIYEERERTRSRSEQVREWWLEYRVASQFSKTWDDVEDVLRLAEELKGTAPTPLGDTAPSKDGVQRQTPRSTISSAQYWMQQVDVPRWFRRDELGIGTGQSIFSTLAGLEESNARRQKRYEAQAARLVRRQKPKRARRR